MLREMAVLGGRGQSGEGPRESPEQISMGGSEPLEGQGSRSHNLQDYSLDLQGRLSAPRKTEALGTVRKGHQVAQGWQGRVGLNRFNRFLPSAPGSRQGCSGLYPPQLKGQLGHSFSYTTCTQDGQGWGSC